MAEPAKAIEKLTEQEITDQYLEQREEGKTTDLPVPPPTIPETIPEPVKAAEEPKPEEKPAEKLTDQQAVDAYLAEREGRKRKERGGAKARIDQLIKEKAELEEKVKAAEAAKVLPAAEPPKTEPPKAEPAKEVPKARPKMNEYQDVDEYHAAMALWAVEERARTNGTAPKIEEPKPVDTTTQHLQVRKEEFDRFLENGKRFIAGHSDFNSTLEAAHVRGLTMSEAARTAITRLAVPEVAYWLAKPENDMAARALMGMDDLQQVVEIGRIAERLAVSPADFVSSAPTPGIRLQNGNTRSTVPLSQLETDDYIRMRKQEKRASRGR